LGLVFRTIVLSTQNPVKKVFEEIEERPNKELKRDKELLGKLEEMLV